MIYDLQKASLMKRFSAFLLDFILITILCTGFMWMLSAVTDMDGVFESLDARRNEIEESYNIPDIVEEYNIDFNNFLYLTDEEKASIPQDVQDTVTACIDEINTDSEYNRILLLIINLILIIISLSLLLSFVVLEFIVPLLLKNGQTVGKKIFSIAVMQTNCVKISAKVLFIRSILGKYTVGTMVPALMLIMLFFGMTLFGTIFLIPFVILVLLLIFQLICLIATKTNSFIHDLLSSTVAVDFQSQMIFDSLEAKNEYTLRIHSEDTSKAD